MLASMLLVFTLCADLGRELQILTQSIKQTAVSICESVVLKLVWQALIQIHNILTYKNELESLFEMKCTLVYSVVETK